MKTKPKTKTKIYQQIQHRAEKRYLSQEIQLYLEEHYPEIEATDMVEIHETRSIELNNTWKTKEGN